MVRKFERRIVERQKSRDMSSTRQSFREDKKVLFKDGTGDTWSSNWVETDNHAPAQTSDVLLPVYCLTESQAKAVEEYFNIAKPYMKILF